MNGKKAKAIRRAMRKELEKGSQYQATFHGSTYTTVMGTKCARYKVTYSVVGGKQLVNLGKKIYNISGILPKEEAV
jgi:hypothetical protein